MRLLVLFFYILTLQSHIDVAPSECATKAHISFSIEAHCGHNAEANHEVCDMGAANHNCVDINSSTLRPNTKVKHSITPILLSNPFEILFANSPFRAPPMAIFANYELPPLYSHLLVTTSQYLC